jgi:hypothetical protein
MGGPVGPKRMITKQELLDLKTHEDVSLSQNFEPVAFHPPESLGEKNQISDGEAEPIFEEPVKMLLEKWYLENTSKEFLLNTENTRRFAYYEGGDKSYVLWNAYITGGPLEPVGQFSLKFGKPGDATWSVEAMVIPGYFDNAKCVMTLGGVEQAQVKLLVQPYYGTGLLGVKMV